MPYQIETRVTPGVQSHEDMADEETYNPWTIVNVVFNHLAEEGLHPKLGDTGHPGEPAAALLRSFGIAPSPEGPNQFTEEVRLHLAELRATMFGEA
jgi:hypothetical protein